MLTLTRRKLAYGTIASQNPRDRKTGNRRSKIKKSHRRAVQAHVIREGSISNPEMRQRWSRLFKSLYSLRSLSTNWNGYGAEAPTLRSIFLARSSLERMFYGVLVPDSVVPSVEGGVGFAFRRGDALASIEICNDGDVVVMQELGGGIPKANCHSTAELPAVIEQVKAFLENGT